jgi:anthranilate phosphoribosyltransferase
MISEAIKRVDQGMDLNKEELEKIFDLILEGEFDEDSIAQFLKKLAQKGESAAEITAAAKAMRKHADSLKCEMDCMDIVGTGGDRKSTFNISTAAAIVCSLFLPVAKHGNRAVSSKSGSADVLEALGIKIDRRKKEAYEFLEKTNFTFLFAPFFHPAMKNVAPVRKKLGIRTIFNLLGPLSNPFNPKFHVIGVFSEDFLLPMFDASEMLSMEHAVFVSSKDGLDEVSISDVTLCRHRDGSKVNTFEFDPRDFGIYADISAIKGYDAKENAKMMIEVFSGEHNDLKNAIAINAAFGLLTSGVESDLKSAFVLARESIENKKALEKLRSLQNA